MKRSIFVLLALCVCLSGCAMLPPRQAADGLAWSGEWVTVGNVIGVETPGGLEPLENNDALSASGMYYAAWSMGEAAPYTNAGGEASELYDAQLYLLLAGYDAAEKAEDAAAEWMEMASERYEIEGAFADASFNGQPFEIAAYTCASGTNPYTRGASAFGVYRNYAISVEVQCQEGSGVDPRAVLEDFLAGCHYAV